MAVLAGLAAHFLVDYVGAGHVSPFDLAVCVLVIGGFIIELTWDDNYGDSGARRSLQAQIMDSVQCIRRSRKMWLLGALQVFISRPHSKSECILLSLAHGLPCNEQFQEHKRHRFAGKPVTLLLDIPLSKLHVLLASTLEANVKNVYILPRVVLNGKSLQQMHPTHAEQNRTPTPVLLLPAARNF